MKKIFIILFIPLFSSCNEQIKNVSETHTLTTRFATQAAISIQAADGVVFFSYNSGLDWENKSCGLPDTTRIGLGAVASDGNLLGLATKNEGVYLFDVEKNLWTNIPTDERIIEKNPGALIFYEGNIYVGTQFGGIFFSKDLGKSWTNQNAGLANLTIRRFAEINDTLYAGTNAGLYSFNSNNKIWELRYGNSTMQVNGITAFQGGIYIGTNQGAFRMLNDGQHWKPVLPGKSLHNIGSDDKWIYAMTYNELYSSSDGQSWQSIQEGLPAGLYTFDVIKNGSYVFAAQWDGVYRKIGHEKWTSYSKGLPAKYGITNIKSVNGVIIVTGSERKLRK